MDIRAASKNEISEFITANKNWKLQNDKLHREYMFRDFISAFAFMSRIAEVAEKMNHHPEWFNVYNKLVVDLTTHDVQAISSMDFELAVTMERLFDEVRETSPSARDQ